MSERPAEFDFTVEQGERRVYRDREEVNRQLFLLQGEANRGGEAAMDAAIAVLYGMRRLHYALMGWRYLGPQPHEIRRFILDRERQQDTEAGRE